MNPLQNLKDIHSPAAIENWPPAYGWWLLALLIIVTVSLLVIGITKARKKRLAKRQALIAISQLDDKHSQALSQLNQILKRVAITYFPEQNIQKMFGQQWQHFLLSTLSSKKVRQLEDSFNAMQQALYQQQTLEETEFNKYQQACETWVKHALPPSASASSKQGQSHA
jgi:hypothetical protein